jgi:hypothetical protein
MPAFVCCRARHTCSPPWDWPLTFTAEGAVEAARAFAQAAIVPLHFEGWQHFSESRPQVERVFARAGLGERLRWPVPGTPITV